MEETKNKIPVNYLNHYETEEASFFPDLLPLKQHAFGRLKVMGFPTKRNEEWKYTDVTGLLNTNFQSPGRAQKITAAEIKPFYPTKENQIALVFENGNFRRDLSQITNIPAGLIAGELQNNLDHPEVKNFLGKIAMDAKESFVALNTALFHQGAFVCAEKNFHAKCEIHLIFINDARLYPVVSYPRNLFVAAQSSSLKISENYYSINSPNASFCNPVTEAFIAENAAMEICKNESESDNDYHIDYTSIIQRKNSSLLINTITSGGKMIRNNLRIELQEKNCTSYLNGLYVIDGNRHVDNHSFVDHASPDCYSNELYKGVLNDKGYGVFNGKIFVRKDAQKTNAYQSNKNMLLSDEATMNSKPQLEIYADDVKCSHGATTGQIDPEAMFYLRSRGIGENESRALLTNAFAEEILDKITIESIREQIKISLRNKLLKVSD